MCGVGFIGQNIQDVFESFGPQRANGINVFVLSMFYSIRYFSGMIPPSSVYL
jgi:hypothetical protein